MKPPKPEPTEDRVRMYGGEKYKRIATSIGSLVDAKNQAYGDSFHQCADFLRLLYPNILYQHQYKDMLAIVRIWDKLKRIATNKDAFGENPWQDIAGYAILMCHENDIGLIPDDQEKSTRERGLAWASELADKINRKHGTPTPDHEDNEKAPK